MTKYGDPYSEFVLCILTHPKHAHTHTHTEQSAAIYAAAPGEQLVRALLKGTLIVVLRVERVLDIHPPQFLPDWGSNSQPFDYKSDSLPLGQDFPYKCLLN